MEKKIFSHECIDKHKRTFDADKIGLKRINTETVKYIEKGSKFRGKTKEV